MLDIVVVLDDKLRPASNGKDYLPTFHLIYLSFEHAPRTMREQIYDGIDSVA